MAHTTHTQPHRPSVTAYRSRSTGGMARIREANSVSPFALTPPQDPSANAPAVLVPPIPETAGATLFVPAEIPAVALTRSRHGSKKAGIHFCSKESSNSVTTLVRKPSEDVAPKLSRARSGYWRNAWWPQGPLWRAFVCFQDGDEEIAGTFLCHKRHVHEIDAEHVARMELQGLGIFGRWSLRYLGPVFFPADGGAS